MSCGVGHRYGLDPAWLGPATAAPIQPLAWELSYAAGVAVMSQEKKKTNKTKQNKTKQKTEQCLPHSKP